jgi:AcrR family transcriptional regulator
MAFADALGAVGTVLNLPKRASTATIESKTNFVRAARPGLLSAETIPLHIGRSTMLWQTTILDESANRVAIVTQTQIVLTESSHRAAPAADHRDPEDARSGNDSGSTRDRIFQVAAKIIATKGFANASMRDIAAASGLSVSSIYQYIESKDDLLAQIFESYLNEIKQGVVEASDSGGSAAERLCAAIDANLDRFNRFRVLINIMNREAKSLDAKTRRRVLNHMDGYIQIFRDIVSTGIKEGEFRKVDPELAAHLVLMMCEIWPQRYWAVGRYGLEGVREGIASMVLDGLRPRAEN